MKLDKHAQATAPKASYNEEMISSPEIRPRLSQADDSLSKKLSRNSFNWVRAGFYLFFAIVSLSFLFLYRYNARGRIAVHASTTTHEVEWDSLSEEGQLAEAVIALSHSNDPPVSPAEPASLTLVKTLDHSLVPQAGHQSSPDDGLRGRLVVVGDIHGMKSDLERLLSKLDFDSSRDHLVCAGDMISKGPDSVGVLDLLMQLGASAVRGNHEDGVLRAWKKMNSKSGGETHVLDSEREDFDSEYSEARAIVARGRKHKNKVLAKQLTNEHVKWLKRLPVILKVGDIKGMGSLVVVHAGLMPGLKLKMQEPYMAMNIRTINLKKLIPSERHKGTVWTKLWNKFQDHLPEKERTTVIYGHDSRRGLSLGEFTKGIDTGCVKGGKLTAFVIEGGKREVKTSIVHVKCKGKRL